MDLGYSGLTPLRRGGGEGKKERGREEGKGMGRLAP